MNLLKFLFTPYVIFELILIYFFVSAYGFLTFFLEIVVSAVIGLFFIFRAGFSQIFSPSGILNIVSGGNILGTLGFGLGGFLLFLPGLMCDFLGILALLAAYFTRSKFQNTQNNTENFTYYRHEWRSSGAGDDFENSQRGRQNNHDGEIIDVEVIDETKSVR